jgi:hypothetical protein
MTGSGALVTELETELEEVVARLRIHPQARGERLGARAAA